MAKRCFLGLVKRTALILKLASEHRGYMRGEMIMYRLERISTKVVNGYERNSESLVFDRRSTLKALNVIRWFVVVAALVAWAGLMALPALGDSGTDLFVPLNLPAPGETELTIGELTPSALPVTGNTGEVFVPSNLPAPGWTELTIGELALSALVETEPGDIWWASNGASDTPGMLPVTGMVPGSHINPSAVFTRERAPETLPRTFPGARYGNRGYGDVLHSQMAPRAMGYYP
jgi:hypothetical protein